MGKNDTSIRPPNLTLDHVTLIFDLLTTKIDRFIPCHADHLCKFAAKSNLVPFVFKNITFTRLITT